MRRWLAVALLLLAPGVLRAQTAARSADPFESWRADLNQRLDQDIARMGAARLPISAAPSGRALEVRYPLPAQPVNSVQPPLSGAPLWFPTVALLLRAQGLPASLLGVAEVESGFDPIALSAKGARGLWQLMPATARRYGLVVEPGRDERLDPLKSTLAASRYLKSLHAQFGDWPLALAAYNSGEQRVQRSLARLGARDFWTLSRAGALPDETRRYVPAVLAKLNAFPNPADTGPLAASPPRIIFAVPAPDSRSSGNSK